MLSDGSDGRIRRLAGPLRGELVLPSDPGYDRARRVWNGAIDKRPAAIAYCLGAEDVVAALDAARSAGLPFSVRSGGHNVAGKSLVEGGLVIDLSRMKQRVVDEHGRTCRADAGLTLSEFDASTQSCGLATTMGVNGTTGIAGLTLGGGFGKLGRRLGLACDNLLSAEIVTADGRILRASGEENDDLFWGLRGGGGNFGIVTSFEYRLHPIGPEIVAGSITFPEARCREAIRLFHDFACDAPDELNLDGALFTAAGGERMFAVSMFHSGSRLEAEQVLRPLLDRADKMDAQHGLAGVPYLQVQSAGDAAFPPGDRYFWKAQFMRHVPDEAIEILLEHYRRAPSPRALAVFQQVGGAIARVPATATAYACRDAYYDFFPLAIWTDPTQDDVNARWVRDTWSALAPFSTGGVYVNNLGEEGQERVESAYGPNYQRLLQIKTRYDPENVFSQNQNIRSKN